MRVAAMLILVLGFGGLSAADKEDEWVKSSGPGFEGLFPAKPVVKSGKITTEIELKRGGIKMISVRINVNPLPVDTSDAAAMKKIFDTGRDTTLKVTKGAKVVAEKDLAIGKHPARDIEFETPQWFDQQRHVFTPTRTYNISIMGPKEYVEGPEVKKFLENFKIKD